MFLAYEFCGFDDKVLLVAGKLMKKFVWLKFCVFCWKSMLWELLYLDNNFGWMYNWFLWNILGTNFGILWVSILLFLCLNILGCCSYVFMIKMNTDFNWCVFIFLIFFSLFYLIKTDFFFNNLETYMELTWHF